MNSELKKSPPKTLPKIKVDKDEMDQFPANLLEIDPFWKEVYEGSKNKTNAVKSNSKKKTIKNENQRHI